jgi:hypothetical protein
LRRRRTCLRRSAGTQRRENKTSNVIGAGGTYVDAMSLGVTEGDTEGDKSDKNIAHTLQDYEAEDGYVVGGSALSVACWTYPMQVLPPADVCWCVASPDAVTSLGGAAVTLSFGETECVTSDKDIAYTLQDNEEGGPYYCQEWEEKELRA